MYTVEYEKKVEEKYWLTVYQTRNKKVVCYSLYNGLTYVLTTLKVIEI